MADSTNNQLGGPVGKRRQMSLATLLLLPALVVTFGACDSLLEVDLPGAVTSEALNDPRLAETLVLGAEGDFECGVVDTMTWAGLWYELFLNTSSGRPQALSGLRSQLLDVYADPCDSGTGPIWTIMQVPRIQAKKAIELIDGFDPAPESKNELLARAYLIQGYSIQILSENHCNVTFDAGPLLSREEGFALAEESFTTAIGLATGQPEVLAAAYIGRARSNLYQDDATGVIADASNLAIVEGFEWVATYDLTPGRRNNRIAEGNIVGDGFIPHRSYSELMISEDGMLNQRGGGVPDPRVVVTEPGKNEPRGIFKYREQEKYPAEDTSIPIATWREALLMRAEVQGGEEAVRIINILRTNPMGLPQEVDESAWPLPMFTSTDNEEIRLTVLEERRRELWMQSHRGGDKLRTSYPAWEQVDEYGQPIGPGRCLPVPFLEVASNPNL